MNSIKSLPIIIVLLLLPVMATPAAAQEKPQSKKNESAQKQATEKDAGQPRFVDEDGDGINDNARAERQEHTSQQVRERRRDRFIDVDGDGINDDRCSGVGVRGGERRGQQKGGGGQ